MTRKLTSKQRQMVKLKVAGKTNKAIAKKLYPDTSPKSAQVQVSQQLHRPTVQQALEQAYARHNLTPDRLVKPISDALDAEKTNDITGEISVDHNTRLKAASIGLRLMGADRQENVPQTNVFINIAKDDAKEFIENET